MPIVRDSFGRLYNNENGLFVDENALDGSELRSIQRRLGEPTDQDRQAANKAANAAAQQAAQQAAQRAATPATSVDSSDIQSSLEGINDGQNPNLDKLGNPLPDPKYRTPPGLIPPDPNAFVTFALVNFVNPSTGQKFTAGKR